MKFTLIIGTLNRLEALKSCLDSIFHQTYKNYEIIVIDQSDHDETENYIKSLKQSIIYRHVQFKGLSRARNEALKLARGDYFCLLDDDAYYDKDYLQVLINNIQDDRTVISGYIWDTARKTDFVKYPKQNKSELTLNQIIKACPSAGLTIPLNAYKMYGGFDEQFGVGSSFGAGEETDYLIRIFINGYKIQYVKNAQLKHPVPLKPTRNAFNIQKRFSYFKGIGALYKKHMLYHHEYYLITSFTLRIFKSFLKTFMPFKFDSEYTRAEIKGFLTGFKEYKDEVNL